MKAIYLVTSILLALNLIGCATEKADNLEGAWQLVSGKYTSPDTSGTLEANENLKAFKIFGRTRYANLAQDTTQQLFVAHGGTYRLAGDEYSEYFDIDQNVQSIGGSATYKYQIDGNQFRISNENLSEVWQKIE